MEFDKSYYESNNYTNYLGREDRYTKLADEVMTHLKTFDLVQSPILDFGCAVGFLMRGLAKYGDVYGVDVSDWAIEQASAQGLKVQKTIDPKLDHGMVFALDVFEHIPEKDLERILLNIRTKLIVFRMPVCANEGEDYVLNVSRVDPTHVIRWTKNQWRKLFENLGYFPLDLNLSTIYNSPGVYTGIAIRTNARF